MIDKRKSLLILFMSITILSYGQTSDSASVFAQFEKAVRKVIGRNVNFEDSLMHVFYGDKLTYSISLRNDYAGEKFVLEYREDSLSDSVSNDWSRLSYFQFMNRFVERKDSVKYQLSGAKNAKCIILVNCSLDAWIQFYFDQLLYGKDVTLIVTVDYFKAKKERVVHKRELWFFKYVPHKGFGRRKKMLILSWR